MEVANASMYDGSTAMAEAYLMAQRVTRRDKIVVAETVHPEYREVARSYTQHGEAEIVEAGFDTATGRLADLSALDDKTAALSSNRRTFSAVSKISNDFPPQLTPLVRCFIVVVTEAISFGLLKSPGECGAELSSAKASRSGSR